MLLDMSELKKGKEKSKKAFKTKEEEVNILSAILSDLERYIFLVQGEGSYLTEVERSLLKIVRVNLNSIVESSADTILTQADKKPLEALGFDSQFRKQYMELKGQYPHDMFLFLVDDHYDLYFEDALKVNDLVPREVSFNKEYCTCRFSKDKRDLIASQLHVYGCRIREIESKDSEAM